MSADRILIVEDDNTIGASLLQALGSGGFEPAWERTGAGALRALEEHVPDLILLDLGLPDVDGVQLCRQLRQLAQLAAQLHSVDVRQPEVEEDEVGDVLLESAQCAGPGSLPGGLEAAAAQSLQQRGSDRVVILDDEDAVRGHAPRLGPCFSQARRLSRRRGAAAECR